MGGTSSSQQQQQSTTNPWAPAQPALQGILGQLQGNLSNTGVTAGESNALDAIVNNSNNPAISNYTTSLLNGGGALNQAGAVNQNYQNYYNATNPLASNTNYNPYSTPGFSDAVNTLTSDITNSVNGQFAAAGRDGSPANSQALARGITQGISPVIQQQYNQNVQNQQGAAGNLYSAGNTNAGILSGLQQQYLANQGQGVSSINTAPMMALQAEMQRQGIPIQNLGLLASIGVPIAGLGGQSTGQSQGSQTMSGADQFNKIATGTASLGKFLFG